MHEEMYNIQALCYQCSLLSDRNLVSVVDLNVFGFIHLQLSTTPLMCLNENGTAI